MLTPFATQGMYPTVIIAIVELHKSIHDAMSDSNASYELPPLGDTSEE